MYRSTLSDRSYRSDRSTLRCQIVRSYRSTLSDRLYRSRPMYRSTLRRSYRSRLIRSRLTFRSFR